MKRFLTLLIPIVLLLVAIPILLYKGMIVPAKVAGFSLIVITILSLRIWLRRALKKKMAADAVRFNINHRHYLNELSPIYRNMSKSEKKGLEKRMGKLLSDLQFDDTTREELDTEEMLAYALFQVLTIYQEPYKSLKGWMIVFDQTNNTGELTLSEGKYVLLNPVLLQNILKEAATIESFSMLEQPIISQLREVYRES